MLQDIRDRSQGWIVWIIVGLLIVAFAFFGIENYLTGGSSKGFLAEVNGVKITVNELGNEFLDAPVAQREMILKQAINTAVLKQDAVNAGYVVSDAAVGSYISSMPAFQDKGTFSPEKLQAYLSYNYLSPEAFESRLKNIMVLSQPRYGIESSAFVLPGEVNRLAELLKQERNIQYIQLPLATFKSKVNVSSTQIQQYYDTHKVDYTTPAKVSVQYVTLNPKTLAERVNVSNQQIEAYYKANIDRYSKPETVKYTEVKVELGGGKKVESVQQQALDAVKALKEGKKLPSGLQATESTKSVNMIDLTTKNALSKLSVGGVTQPISQAGYYLILKLDSKQPAVVKPMSAVKSSIEETIKQENAGEEYQKLYNELYDLAYSNNKPLDLVAKKLGLTLQSTPMFGKEGGNSAITKNTKVVDAAFENIGKNQNSQLINLDSNQSQGQIVVLRANKSQPQKVKPLSDVSGDIKTSLVELKARKLIQQTANAIKTRLSEGVSTSKVIEEFANDDVTRKTPGYVSQENKDVDSVILAGAFSLPVPVAHKDSVGDFELKNGDYAVVVLHATKAGKVTNDEKTKLSKKLTEGAGLAAYTSYAEGLVKSAKVKYSKVLNKYLKQN